MSYITVEAQQIAAAIRESRLSSGDSGRYIPVVLKLIQKLDERIDRLCETNRLWDGS
jgi:hypothetical protein